MRVGGQVLNLERYAIDGVVWGKETLWLDAQGAIAAAITRAGGLGFEAVREDLERRNQGVRRAMRSAIASAIWKRSPRPSNPCGAGSYALLGATIVDGTNRPPIADGAVLVENGRIADGRPARRRRGSGWHAAWPTSRGKTIIPGLWDMHTHATQVEWAPVYLAAGVTTVRDMGNEFEFITALRDAVASKRALGPRFLAAGLIDGAGPNAFGVITATTPEEAKAGRGEVPRRRLPADEDLQHRQAGARARRSVKRRIGWA